MSASRDRYGRRYILGTALFILFVAVSGYWLNTQGLTDNPFTAISSTLAFQRASEDQGFTLVSPDAEGQSAPTRPAEGAEPPGDRNQAAIDIRWDEANTMLYDLWFCLAATAIVLVAGPLLKLMLDRNKSQGRRVHRVA
ncbi:MAG: hypothetical protein KDD92_08445 [Caldilineaceae bacterium]|nr:hypothetical protein [Caldilineaceae bacterium]